MDPVIGVEGKCLRRSLRIAVHGQDTSHLKGLVERGADVNTTMSDVFLDTPLICAVRYGYLGIVEMLVGLPTCDLDQKDRNKCTALDEAIRCLLIAATSVNGSQVEVGRRYRILLRLLISGATSLTESLLNSHIYSAVISREGNYVIGRLIKAVSERGHIQIRSALMKCLLPYCNISFHIRYLLLSGADPRVCGQTDADHELMSLENALLLATATSDESVLNRIEQDASSSIESIDGDRKWETYCKVLQLLCLSGYHLQLFVMNYLYYNHAQMYLWVSSYRTNPAPLCHLARVSVRRCFQPNVFKGIHKLKALPDKLRTFLIFKE